MKMFEFHVMKSIAQRKSSSFSFCLFCVFALMTIVSFEVIYAFPSIKHCAMSNFSSDGIFCVVELKKNYKNDHAEEKKKLIVSHKYFSITINYFVRRQ